MLVLYFLTPTWQTYFFIFELNIDQDVDIICYFFGEVFSYYNITQ